MHPLPHGYTNRTLGDGGRVVKTYQGPDAAARLLRERRALVALADALSVPTVLDTAADSLTLEHLPGVHGQELIERGHGREVLRSCGRLLRQLQDIPASIAPASPRHPAKSSSTAIIRAHHPADRPALADFHAAYGQPVPPWPARQAAMLARCRELEAFCTRWQPGGPGVRQC